MLREVLSWEGLCFLVFGVMTGALYYNLVLEPRDKKLYKVMECMDDLNSRAEYDRCVQLTSQ